MNLKVLAVVALTLTAGCTANRHWVKPDTPVDELEQDTFVCAVEAEDEFTRKTQFRASAEKEFIRQCLEAKGWTEVQ